MKVLLKEGADQPTPATILVLPAGGSETTLETLSGEAVTGGGIVTQAEFHDVAAAINASAGPRPAQRVMAKALLKDAEWMAKVLGPYEVGSKIGVKETGSGTVLDDSQATRVNRAEGLAVGDAVAIGPNISPRWFMNARGRVVSIKGDRVAVELDDGDRDRIERANGKGVVKQPTFPLDSVEKVR